MGPGAPPLASVVIPAYNREDFIADTIETALAQTYSPVEVIVVDDGSTDRSAEIADSYGEVRVVRLPRNGGPSVARNEGVAVSRGEFLVFADSDDLMAPTRVQAQVAPLIDDPGLEVTVALDQDVLLEEGATMPDWDRRIAPGMFEDLSDDATLVQSNSIVTRRSTFDRIGPFDPGIFGGEDLDWKLRALEGGARLKRVDGRQITRRIHDGNISQDHEVCERALLDCFRARLLRRRRAGFSPTEQLGPRRAPS